MSPFWQNLDMLPSSTREKAREKKERSPEEYAEGREKVQEQVQQAKEHMKLNDVAADVLYYIEMNEEELKEKMQKESLQDVAKDFSSYDARQWRQMQQAFQQGQFDLAVTQTDDGRPAVSMTMTLPEGNVQEKVQIAQSLQEALVTAAQIIR